MRRFTVSVILYTKRPVIRDYTMQFFRAHSLYSTRLDSTHS